MINRLPLVLLALTVAAGAQTAPTLQAARLNNLGTAYMNQQLPVPAAHSFAQARAADPRLTIAALNLGIAEFYQQHFPQALEALEAAHQQAPTDPHATYTLGLLYRAQNQSDLALAAFRQTIALDPADPDTHYQIGNLELSLDNLPAATAEFRKALEANPLHASAQFGLGRALRRQGEAEPARVALAAFSHITSAHLGFPLSHIYGEEGRYARVEDALMAPTAAMPMLPITFHPLWTLPATGSSAGWPCILQSNGASLLVLLGSGQNGVRLLRQTGSLAATRFEPVAHSGIELSGTATACAVGDYDNDGLPDIAVATVAPGNHLVTELHLFRNLGNDHFEDVTAAAGILPSAAITGLLFVDYDHDGDLDLLATGTNTLWRNNGNKTFTRWTREAGLEGGADPTNAAMLSDLNNDRAVDLITTGMKTMVYTNHREGPFSAAPLASGPMSPTRSAQTLDFDKDGWMDVLLTHAGAPGVSLWQNQKGIAFSAVALPLPGVTGASAAIPIDFDNDGWIDIAAIVQTATGPSLRMLRNQGPAGFADVSRQLHLDAIQVQPGATLLAADLTHSGTTDLLISQPDGSVMLLAGTGNTNHALPISLQGLADNKSGIGAKVEVFANGLWQKWEVTSTTPILAGLGTARHADLIRILWPTGVPQDEILENTAATAEVEKPLAKGPIEEIDRRGSSCPTLFAWNGKQYTFVNDVIGAAVIGHWISPTSNNTPDPDEWIKVPANQLTPRDGHYSLRFGEPMEEVNFVDQVRLVAVDHPVAATVYPNEAFLSEPPFAPGTPVGTSTAHTLAAARDGNGKDVLALLSAPPAATPAYVRDFTNLAYAGFATPHTLTFDLGPWSTDKPLRLFLHGFIEYFSASSLYSAWQAGLTPVAPFLEAQAKDGTWHRVVEDMGFPAGLPRTVVVDLTGKLPAGTRQVRMTTNLQIYWDQMLVDNAATPVQPRLTDLALTHASLAFRGYPRQQDGHTSGDLTYDYQHISQTGPFLPHRGAYTRYGDVTPLLQSVDDQFVVFGTGEDMDLEFSAAALPPLPPGYTRDFFFYANGYVKDMDFYEASPFQVGQLPFRGMTRYPYPDAEHYPDDAAHVAYQLEYNTRWEPGFNARPFVFDYQPTPSAPILP